MSKHQELTDAIAAHATGAQWTPQGLATRVLEVMREPSSAATEAMARHINRYAGFGNVSGRDVYQAAIDAELGAAP